MSNKNNKAGQNLFILGLALAVILPLGYFFIPNQQVESPQQTTSDLKIEILQEGDGETATKGHIAVVHYTGSLTDGTVFDSSLARGEPFAFPLGMGQVIPGWDQGVEGMKVGEKRRLTIPPELGYGAAGTPGGPIPPNATLIFDVELVDIINLESVSTS